LLDEPTSALDIANQLHRLGLVRYYTRRTGIVALMILHDLNLVTRFSDTALMLDRGTAAGPVCDMLNRDLPADIYGIECHVANMEDGYVIVYPLAPAGGYPVVRQQRRGQVIASCPAIQKNGDGQLPLFILDRVRATQLYWHTMTRWW
jgi:ABC-type hemin transport system ATPase subunit